MSIVCVMDSASPINPKYGYLMGTVSPLSNNIVPYGLMETGVSFTSGSSAFEEYKVHIPCHIFIDSLPLRGKQLELLKPILGVVRFSDNLCSVENEELGVFTVNEDLNECLREFKRDISFVLSEYGEEPEDNLTDDAKQLKRRILDYVEF